MSMYIRLLLAVLLLQCGAGTLHGAECGNTDQDRLVYARERMYPGASTAQLQLVYQWLQNATRSCPLSGDLWYYRKLLAERLGDKEDTDYALRKTNEHGSQASARNWNPFLVVNPTSARSPDAPRQKYALLVGINTMANSDELLQFASRDANALAETLIHAGGFPRDHVTTLVDEKATTQGIREAFGKIRELAHEDDLVVVYFSSHGSPRKLDPTGLSYVLTYDTDTATAPKLFATAMQMVELAELGRWVKAKDYVLLLDTCYSGAAGLNSTGPAKAAESLDALRGLEGSGNRIVISASRDDEKSYEDQESRHGYFTRFLLEALGTDPAPISVRDVYNYLASRVNAEVARTPDRVQHPVMRSFGNGEAIPLLSSSAAASARLGGRKSALPVLVPATAKENAGGQ